MSATNNQENLAILATSTSKLATVTTPKEFVPSPNLPEADQQRLKAYSDGLVNLGDFWLEEIEPDRSWVVRGRSPRGAFDLMMIFYSDQKFHLKAF
jgi:hypothetical protein